MEAPFPLKIVKKQYGIRTLLIGAYPAGRLSRDVGLGPRPFERGTRTPDGGTGASTEQRDQAGVDTASRMDGVSDDGRRRTWGAALRRAETAGEPDPGPDRGAGRGGRPARAARRDRRLEDRQVVGSR